MSVGILNNIPRLNIAANVSSFVLENLCLEKQVEIENWFKSQWCNNQVPIYGSVDLRNSGFKLVPVDMNLFPGGFNNICPQFTSFAVDALTNWINTTTPKPTKVLLIPENHTRNQAYLKNVYVLSQILAKAGLEVAIGSVDTELNQAKVIKVNEAETKTITYLPLMKQNRRIKTITGFEPDLILLNNDLSNGIPPILMDIEQKILPTLNAGWYMRKKTNFFIEYNQVAKDFANLVGIDEWLINPYFELGSGLDFAKHIGFEELSSKVDDVLAKIKNKYLEYKINEEPYVVVKANNGTYGMGIMVVKSGAEILAINRKSRNKMAVIKDGQHVEEVIIQEGVPTIEVVSSKTAEPVVYMIHDKVIGSFYRVHGEKGATENLNAMGASFVPLDFNQTDNQPNRFYPYSVIARLALLASSLEIKKYR